MFTTQNCFQRQQAGIDVFTINLHPHLQWSSASSSRKFCSSLMLVEILWRSKATTFSHECQCFYGNSVSSCDFSGPLCVHKALVPDTRSLFSSVCGLHHLPKALNRETISCRLSWNVGPWTPDMGRASICRPENKIFSDVPNP